MRQLTLLIALTLALTPSVLAQNKDAKADGIDRIDRTSGGALANVTVVKEDFNTVTYRKKGGSRVTAIPSVQVIDIVRGDTPQALREGKAKVLAGDLKGALAPLQLAARNATPWVKEYAHFYLGEALRKLGRAQDAVRAYEAVIATKADTRFLPLARLGIATAWTADKSFGKAQGVLESFIREVDSKRMHRQYALRAKQALGHNLVAQGKFAAASREYDSVITEARSLWGRAKDDDEKSRLHLIMLRAERDKGSALVQDKKYNDANRIFSRLATTRDDPLARAIGMMGQGELSLAQGDPDLARVRLSEVTALGFNAEEERPRALRLLAECYIALKGKEKDAETMAAAYIEDLLTHHPGTEDAKVARDLQQKLK